MEYLHLEVSNSVVDGKSKRITHLWEDSSSKKTEIFYEFDRIIPWSENTLLDGHVLAILLYASSRGKNLKVHGALSHALLRNMEEIQLAWCLWRPEVYKKIDIIPDRIDNTRKIVGEEKAISAFSGGVDAMFTALRHTRMLPESTRYPLRSTLMVHGFDVDIYNYEGFNNLTKRVQPILSELNLDLRTLRTNSRELKLQEWDDSHAFELAACLHMYSDEFEFGMIGSTDCYDALVTPWGSNPVTDHFLSGSKLSIIHDGAGFSRTDKVAEIIKHKIACKVLKVCWAGADQSGNCGVCEKCVRTRLNFLAAGSNKTPECFPNELDMKLIAGMQLQTYGHFAEVESISQYAKKHNVSGQWVDLLNARIEAWKPMDAAVLEKMKKGGLLKRMLVKLLMVVKLDEPVKKIWRSSKRSIAMNKIKSGNN